LFIDGDRNGQVTHPYGSHDAPGPRVQHAHAPRIDHTLGAI